MRNFTGFVLYEPAMGGKWLQMLSDAVPHIKQMLVVAAAGNPSSAGFMRSVERLRHRRAHAQRSRGERFCGDRALCRGSRRNAERGPGRVAESATAEGDKIVALAARRRVPAIYPFKYFARIGGLRFDGTDNVDQWGQAASYVDRILRGVHPRDFPIELPTGSSWW